MAFSFTVTHNDVSPALSAMARAARNPEPIFRAMGTTFKSITEGTFNSVGASFRPAPWRPKWDGTPSNLQKSTTLAKAFHLAVSATGATLNNPMPYAAIHQFGGVIRPKAGKTLKFKTPAGWRSAKQVTIPPRPYFPVINDRITPAAEDLIRRAGERALLRQSGQATGG